jgi:hypothetical protein
MTVVTPNASTALPALPTQASAPPDGMPTYRLLTGPDDASFCRRVSDALALGYRLYGSPAATFNGHTVIVAQAIVWPGTVV